jgi:hypothetical protein
MRREQLPAGTEANKRKEIKKQKTKGIELCRYRNKAKRVDSNFLALNTKTNYSNNKENQRL